MPIIGSRETSTRSPGSLGNPTLTVVQKDGTIDDGHEFISGGRYVDSLTKRNGVWRFANREITVEWKHFRPATHGDPGSGIEKIVAPASRDRDDVAYRFFAAIGR